MRWLLALCAGILTLPDHVAAAGPPPSAGAAGTGRVGVTSPEKSEFQKRARFWCFQPIQRMPPPAPSAQFGHWARNPIDRFILAALREHGLTPAREAERHVLIRRLSYDLIGLPPSPGEVAAFEADPSADAYEKLVERLLASPRYAERWARHWLDLVRYAESAGHEYDYDIPGAFRYRDYVIRAFNLDLPYNQFVIEQIAGDLLEPPRRHPVLGWNESMIGTGFYFLGEGTHSPVDVREDQMRRVDNQIDVFSKTFLGLTVACARCHDHKFDPINSADYYALAGFLCSSRHQQAFVDPPERLAPDLGRLRSLKQMISSELRDAAALLPEPIRGQVRALTGLTPVPEAVQKAQSTSTPRRSGEEGVFEDFDRGSFDGWFVTGDAFGARPSQPGDLRLEWNGPASRINSVQPGAAHSGLVSDRLRGVLRSRTFIITTRYLHYLAAGRGGRLSVVVDGYEKIRDPIYGGLTTRVDHGDELRWITQNLEMWRGHSAYLEIADGATVDFTGPTSQIDDGRGYVVVDEIRMGNEPPAPRRGNAIALDLEAVISALRPSHAARAERIAHALCAAREIAARLPDPTLAPGVADGTGSNERIHVRGSHKNLGEVVARRFLEVLGGSHLPRDEAGSGRLELARRLVDTRTNPLVARVLVNRLWKHHFGEGIVSSTDDFGAMGKAPSHPALLDWLASELIDRGWSIKALHRLMVTSRTYRMTSVLQGSEERLDPANAFLHRMNVRRLEPEAIRDALLSTSGRLKSTMYGPSVPVHLTSFMEGRGRPAQSGPADGGGRRSIYLGVRRNFLNPMFLAFDAPVPFSTMGRRNVSNVPAQALILLNNPFVVEQARLWAERAMAGPARTTRERAQELFRTAFAREASAEEVSACLEFLGPKSRARRGSQAPEENLALSGWADLCHVLINMKSFIFID
jgi:hypothetical protein